MTPAPKPKHGHGTGGGGPIRPHGEKAKNFSKTMKTLMRYLKPFRFLFAVIFVFSVLSSLFTIIGPKLIGNTTTWIFDGIMNKVSGKGAGINFEYVFRMVLILSGLYILSAAFNFIQNYLVSGVAQKVSYNLRKEISEKMNRLPLDYFDTRTHGEILSRITNDVDTISQTLNQSLAQIVSSVTVLIGILIMMLSISWLMTLVALIIMPLSFLFISFIIRFSQKYFKRQQEYLGHVNGDVEEIFTGHLVVKAFNRERTEIEKFDELNEVLFKSARKSQFLSGIMIPVMIFIGNLGYVIVCIFGGILAVRKIIQVGDILAFIQYVRSFTQPITQAAQISNVLQSTAAAAERVFEFLDEKEESADTDHPVPVADIKGNVSFRNVKFGYNPEKIIIRNFTATIRQGQKVAVVGPTGAGKTTIVKLLMRFYDVNDGAILIDGNDIRSFKRNDLRDLFGMVLQDAWLFNGTIMENIRYGKLDATDEEVVKAAEAAHVDHFIRTLPDAYDFVLNEEADNVSQGQKQLLTIARAILSDPKILILDEATSSVDTRTEVFIQRATETLMKDRTSFIIAHRLSTIRGADLILVMNDGDIVEQGTHETLTAHNGFYASLYNSQFED
ncbi:MAG: ABC transporter ATP-binding protein/permease [Candidatus Azobacteroides sp.]|nr:ABC transporter ATP-binding protein/permease [Candidatus Azobacteroides sp.]